MKRATQALFALLAAVALGGCAQGEAVETKSVLTAVAEQRDLIITAEATGSVEPVRTVEVKSKASGEILALHVDIGDVVAPGALLAEVDPRDVRNGYNQAEADIQVAQARMEIARAQLDRADELVAAGVITAEEHEAKNLEFANAQAALVKAQTNLELADLRLSDVTIRAPSAGTILTKSVEVGQVIQSASQNVSGGTVLMVMADLEEMQVRTLVDETDMGEIRPGMLANVDVEAFPTRAFQGTVEKIEPQAVVQQNITMFPVIVTLENRDGLLRPGMNAEVEILIAEEPGALTVPNNTVVQPRQVGPAATVLGLGTEAMQVDRSAWRELRQRLASAGGLAGAAGDEPGAANGSDSQPADGRRPPPGMEDIRGRVASGEITRDSARALFQAARAASGGQGVAGAGGATGRPGGGSEASGDEGSQAQGAPTYGQAVVFVVAGDGTIEPRPVLTGLSDWDFTQVVAGLAAGEQVAQIGAAQLQASQDAFLDRIRQRRGGGPF
jgi:HlyD family secretion protein